MAAKDKLTPKASRQTTRIPLDVSAPAINMRLPEVKPQVTVSQDMAPLVEAINALAARLDQQQATIVAILEQFAKKDISVDVAAPKVTVQAPARPQGSYYVEIDKEDGETVGMRISAAALDA